MADPVSADSRDEAARRQASPAEAEGRPEFQGWAVGEESRTHSETIGRGMGVVNDC